MSKSIFPTGKEVSRQGLPWYRYDTAVVSTTAAVVDISGRFALNEKHSMPFVWIASAGAVAWSGPASMCAAGCCAVR